MILLKVRQSTLAREREKFRPLTLTTLKPKQKQRSAPMLKFSQALVQALTPKQKLQLKTVQRQRQMLAPKLPTPAMLKAMGLPPFRPQHFRRRGRRKRRKRPRFGAWFLKHHPIPTPKELMKALKQIT